MKFYRLSDATFYDRMNTIYQFIKPFLDNNMSSFEEYGGFNILVIVIFFYISFHPFSSIQIPLQTVQIQMRRSHLNLLSLPFCY